MKEQMENRITRSKSIVFNTNEIADRKGVRKNLAKVRNQTVSQNGRVQMELKSNRKDGNFARGHPVKGRKELEVTLTVPSSQLNPIENGSHVLNKRRQEQRNEVMTSVKTRRTSQRSVEMNQEQPITEWKEQVVRVGTGYRVRKDEKDPRKRRFDVGYADMKVYKRKDGREAVIDSSNMGRTVIGKCQDARVKVMNAVSAMEKRRRVSEYTGSGILRKSMVGKLKLKSTKAGGKE
jgi:hypothetical protein